MAACAVGVWLLTCWRAGEVLAQSGAPGPVGSDSGTYLSLFWLIFLCLCVAGWLYVTAWVSDDARGVGQNARMWTSILLGAGAFGLLLAFLIHAALAFLMLPAVGGAFVAYVRLRNASVPEHFKLFSRVAARARTQEAAGTPSAQVGQTQRERAHVEMEVVNEDQKSLAHLVEARPQFADAANVLRDIIATGCNARAWSIRVEPGPEGPEGYAVLLELDGVMRKVDALETELGRALVGCAAAFVGITGKGKSKGKLTAIMIGGEEVEVQVRGVRAKHGMAIVLSLPDWTVDIYRSGLAALGMHNAMQEKIERLSARTGRAILISSPPGSGKTSTFHAMVSNIDIFTTDITTLENELEHELDHVIRHQVDLRSEEAFQGVFPGILREEPDVIGVDELTNLRIGEPLFEFAGGDKLLLATFQASSASEAVAHLVQGVDGKLAGHTLACVLNQRLLRKLCRDCREPVQPTPSLLAKLHIDPRRAGTWFRAVGCERCYGAGYRGRTALFEMLIVDEKVRGVISSGRVSAPAVRKAAGQKGIRTLHQDALLKVRQGITTLQEVRRVLK